MTKVNIQDEEEKFIITYLLLHNANKKISRNILRLYLYISYYT